MSERWLPVVGYEGFYEVSSLGRVRSVDRVVQVVRKGKVLAADETNDGYPRATLCRGGKCKAFTIHRLVNTAFNGPPPDALSQTAHGNGVRKDTSPENLRWASSRENYQDSVGHGTNAKGERNGRSRLSYAIADEIRASDASDQVLAKKYNVAPATIWQVRQGRTWVRKE